MIKTAARLFEEQGYAATGLKQVLEESGTPRGSLYFHFPGGKQALALAVVEAHAAAFGARLSAVLESADDTAAAASNAIEMLIQQFDARQCRSGCPVGTIASEMASSSPVLRGATRHAFEGWVAVITQHLVADGHSSELARTQARVVIAAIEGALVMARAYGDAGPLHDIKTLLPALLRAE